MLENCIEDILSISIGNNIDLRAKKRGPKVTDFPSSFLIELWRSETLAENQIQCKQQLGENEGDLNAIFKCQNSACT